MPEQRQPTHDETAADVADDATNAFAGAGLRTRQAARRAFWWIAHHLVARPLALAVPFRGTAWLVRRTMRG